MGSTRYLSEPNKKAVNMNAFKFHLCTEHRKETGGCPYKNECFFIHSKHTLDDSLTLQIEESPVHVCLDVKSYGECPYPTHKYDDEGKGSTSIVVFDHGVGQYVVMEAGCAYVTKGSAFALQESLKSPNGALVIRQVVSEKLRVCFCTHYDRGWCARGDTCLYVHRVKMNGKFMHTLNGTPSLVPAATATTVSSGSDGSVLQASPPQLVPLMTSLSSPMQSVLVPGQAQAVGPMYSPGMPPAFGGFPQQQQQQQQLQLQQPQFVQMYAPQQQPMQQQTYFQLPQQQHQQQVMYAQVQHQHQQQQPLYFTTASPGAMTMVTPQQQMFPQQQVQQNFVYSAPSGGMFVQQGYTTAPVPAQQLVNVPTAAVQNPFLYQSR